MKKERSARRRILRLIIHAVLFLIVMYCLPLWSQSLDHSAKDSSFRAAAKLQAERPSMKAVQALSTTVSAASSRREKDSPSDLTARKPIEGGVSVNRQDQTASASRPGLVQDIRHLTANDYTRVIIDLDREAQYSSGRVSNPDRIYFDVFDSRLNHDLLNKIIPIGDKFLRRIRVSQNRSDIVRVVLDVAESGELSIFELRDPFRIVIDIHAGNVIDTKTVYSQPGKELLPIPEELPSPSIENSAQPDTMLHLKEMSRLETPSTSDSEKPELDELKAPLIEPIQSPVQGAEARTITEPLEVGLGLQLEERGMPAASVRSLETEKFLLPAKPAVSEEPQQPSYKKFFTLHGESRNETAYRVASQSRFAKIKNFAYLDMTGKITPRVNYDLSTRIYYDALFSLSKTFAGNVKRDQQWDAELRNAFIDIDLGRAELRLGKQQIVWGQAVNLFFADVVNPRDLREFVLPNLNDIRIPTWAADLEFYFGNTHIEFVGLPILEHDKAGVPGSEFAFQIPSAPAGAILNVADIKMPANNARNGVYGFRFSQLIRGWDVGGFYLYGYDYSPTLFRCLGVDPATGGVAVNVTPEIMRKRTAGATFSKDAGGGVIIKGEFVYDKDRFFAVIDPLDLDGVTKSDFFEYLFGLDYTFFKKVDFNAQFFQQFILKPVDALFQDDRASYASIWLKTGFFGSRLEPELFAISKLPKSRQKVDFMLRPKLNFILGSHWRSALGADLFGGNSHGVFGQFNSTDRIYLEMRHIF
jgi:hypothetical protein